MPGSGNKVLTNLDPNDPNDNNSNFSNFIPGNVGNWPKTWKGIPLNNYFREPGTYFLYVQVDSFNDNLIPGGSDVTGEVLEGNEGNNLFGPITIVVGGSPLSSSSPAPAAEESEPLDVKGRPPVRP